MFPYFRSGDKLAQAGAAAISVLQYGSESVTSQSDVLHNGRTFEFNLFGSCRSWHTEAVSSPCS